LARAEAACSLLLLALLPLQPYLQQVLSEELLAGVWLDHSTSKDTLISSSLHGSETPQSMLPGNALTIRSCRMALAEEMGVT